MARKRRKPRPRRPAPPKPAAEPAPSRTKAAASERRRAAAADERPPAPWGSFPLVELVVLVGLVMLAIGFFVGGDRGTTLMITGLALGSLAGLELSVREHFAGYRSHTTLLAGAASVVAMGVSFYLAELEPVPSIAIGVGVGAGAAWLLVRTFRARAGRAVKLR
jgi:hypothetical protein